MNSAPAILITGGAGFIGSHLVDNLLEAGWRVVVLDDLRAGLRTNVDPRARLVEEDLEWEGLADLLTEEGIGVVSHHAAQSNVRTSVASPLDDARTNILGSLALLDACHRVGISKVLFASSGGTVYGIQETFPCDEDHPTRPIAPYGCSKLAVEHYLLAAARRHELEPTILRYANIYGPRQDPKGEAGIVAILLRTLLAGQRPRIFGDGLQTRDYVHVDDVARIHRHLVENWTPGTFNVGTGVETSLVDLVDRVTTLVGRHDLEPVFEPARAEELRRNLLSPARLLAATGLAPELDLRAGLARTLSHFQNR